MKFEKSCGAVVFKVKNEKIEALLIKMKGGHWSFPKGHVENSETEIETALREIKEETNLDVVLDARFREMVSYSPAPNVVKDVIFFIAFIKSESIILQEAEVEDYKWVSFQEGLNIITYDTDKKVFKKAFDYLERKM